MSVMWKEVEKGEKLEKISIREVGERIFQSNLVRLPDRLRVVQGH